MKKTIIACLLVLATVIPAFAAERSLGIDEFTSVDELAAAISAYFPKAQGEVKSVQGDRVTVSVGSKDGILVGVNLTLWRDGKEFRHPVSGALLGRAEDEVGSMEVASVGEAISTGVIRKKVLEPKVGDKARITPKKIGLALIPLRADKPEIIQELATRLNAYGRFTVLDSEKTAAFLKGRKQRDSSLAKEIGRTFNLDVVAAVGVYPSDNKYLVTTRLFYTDDDARLLNTIAVMIDLRTKRDSLGEVKPFFAPAKMEKGSLDGLPFDAQLFQAGDLEGTGRLQYVFSDGSRLHIYQEGPAGWREVWTETTDYAASEMQLLNLDIADINNDGKQEIFATGMLNGAVVSYVIESRDGVFKRVADMHGFLRVIKYPRKGSILIGQSYDPAKFYAGQPKEYVWSNGRYVAGPEFSLPPGVGLYGFMLADMGEADHFLVALDDAERLRVYSKGILIWKSEETYPTVGVTIKKPVTGLDEMFSKTAAEDDKAQLVKIPGRIFAMDVNNDGKDEIMLPKNSGATFLTGHKAADLYGLGWNGTRMEVRWNIKDLPGAVLDYQVVRLQTGAQVLTLLRSLGGVLTKDTVRVMTYEVK